jgi:hypothetical protein
MNLPAAGPDEAYNYARTWSLSHVSGDASLRVGCAVLRVHADDTADAADDAETYAQLVGFAQVLTEAGFAVTEVFEGWRTVALDVVGPTAAEEPDAVDELGAVDEPGAVDDRGAAGTTTRDEADAESAVPSVPTPEPAEKDSKPAKKTKPQKSSKKLKADKTARHGKGEPANEASAPERPFDGEPAKARRGFLRRKPAPSTAVATTEEQAHTAEADATSHDEVVAEPAEPAVTAA